MVVRHRPPQLAQRSLVQEQESGKFEHSRLRLNRFGGIVHRKKDDMKQTKWQRLATIGLCSSLVINAFSGVTAVAETVTIESSPTAESSAKEETQASSVKEETTKASTENSQVTTDTSQEEATKEAEKEEPQAEVEQAETPIIPKPKKSI